MVRANRVREKRVLRFPLKLNRDPILRIARSLGDRVGKQTLVAFHDQLVRRSEGGIKFLPAGDTDNARRPEHHVARSVASLAACIIAARRSDSQSAWVFMGSVYPVALPFRARQSASGHADGLTPTNESARGPLLHATLFRGAHGRSRRVSMVGGVAHTPGAATYTSGPDS